MTTQRAKTRMSGRRAAAILPKRDAKPRARRRVMSGLPCTQTSATAETLGHRIQQSLQVILAGLDERVALSGLDIEALRRDLRMLLEFERIQIATAEIDKAEKILEYMLRPSIEECLNLWFGKSEQTDQEVWHQF